MSARSGSKVLVVSHEASRTGAPRIAALVASCLLDQGFSVRIVSQRPGPLEAEFAAVAPTSVEPGWRVRRRLWSRSGRGRTAVARTLELAVAVWTILRSGADVVYVNSTAAAAYVRAAGWLRRRAVLHVHESGDVLSGFLARVGLRGVPAGVPVVACSPSVADALRGAGVPADRIDLVVSVPDGALVRAGAAADRGGAGAPVAAGTGEAVLVGGCGAVEHRKGVDLWLRAAERARAELDVLRFTWVGQGTPPEGIADSGVARFPGPSDNPYAEMAAFDIMTLPSRDDPFPLVVMEAMLLGKPVVAFEVGGVAAQLGSAGVLVPALDVVAFASEVVALAKDPGRRARLGSAARARAEELFSTEAFGRGLSEVMAKVSR
jgi:glycosyltransferase involved in cell wall biosynthesis